MKNSFQERLARLGGEAPNSTSEHDITKQEVEPVKTPPKTRLRRKEKVALALTLLQARGVSPASAYPPIFRWFSKIGIHIKPPIYWSFISLLILGLCIMFSIFGGILASGIGANSTRGPIAGLYRLGWPGVMVIGSVAGFLFAVLTRLQKRRHRVPNWRDLW